jgi:hypothetical protein
LGGSNGLAKSGLGQVDLNLLVQLSLAGLIGSPEQYLSQLLRSQLPIEARTRKALADALDGRLAGSRLKVQHTQHSKLVRKFRRERHQIKIGRRVAAMMAEEAKTYDDVVEKVAIASRESVKWVQAGYTKANKLADWIAECRNRGLNHTDAALEMAFAYSTLRGVEPPDSLKPTVEGLADIIAQFDQIVVDAAGNARGARFL